MLAAARGPEATARGASGGRRSTRTSKETDPDAGTRSGHHEGPRARIPTPCAGSAATTAR